MPRRYTVLTIHGSMIADGTITTSKLADLAVTTPKLADKAVTRPKTTPPIASTSEILLTKRPMDIPIIVIQSSDASKIIFQVDKHQFIHPWNTADSVGKPNLFNPAITQSNDGDTSTFNQASVTGNVFTDVHIKLDMGAVGKYLTAYRVALTNPSDTQYAQFQLLASPDDVTYTGIVSNNVLGPVTDALVVNAAFVSGYRFFKTQLRSTGAYNTVTSKLQELAIWAE
jgi:hypothetical protein